jgi:hypothetical protein
MITSQFVSDLRRRHVTLITAYVFIVDAHYFRENPQLSDDRPDSVVGFGGMSPL